MEKDCFKYMKDLLSPKFKPKDRIITISEREIYIISKIELTSRVKQNINFKHPLYQYFYFQNKVENSEKKIAEEDIEILDYLDYL